MRNCGVGVLWLLGPSLILGGTPLRVAERVLLNTNEPANPGQPLNENDFWLARQLTVTPTNFTSERKMKPVSFGRALENENQMEELEAKGAKHEKQKTKLGLSKLKYHWPNGVVPYVVDAAFSSAERATIAQGITHIHDNSCVRFVARDGEEDYVDIIPGQGGCYAIIPYYSGRGRCEVGLEQNGCVTMKIVVHELLHALGIKHEQSRPDRDSHITMVWSNIVADGGGQFFRDAWEGTDPATLPAECDDTGAVDGTDYSSCYSGWTVDACGFGYDYTSVMHYRLNSFAIDSSQNVMIPTDASVTAAGNSELSTLDKQKLQCMYNCDGTTYNGCGGHVTGSSGTLDGLDDDKCNWFISVDDGYAIEISFNTFDVDCSDKLIIYDGKDTTAAMLGEYCNDNKPTLVTSSDSKLYISWTRTVSANKIKASWKKVKIECCAKIKLESTGGAASDLGSWMTEFTYTAGDDINDRPIYRAGNLWMAVKTVGEGFLPSWIVSSADFGVDPGSGSGMIFGDGYPKCPTAVSSWSYFNQVDTVVDETLKAVCAVECSNDPPVAPTGSTSDWGGGKSVGTVVTYACGGDDNKYAQCGTDGDWSPATIPPCGSTTAAPVVTEATTEAPACKNKYSKNKMYTGKLIKKVKRVRNVKLCLKKCKSFGSQCVAVRWKKKICFLLSTLGKLKKKKKFWAGACI